MPHNRSSWPSRLCTRAHPPSCKRTFLDLSMLSSSSRAEYSKLTRHRAKKAVRVEVFRSPGMTSTPAENLNLTSTLRLEDSRYKLRGPGKSPKTPRSAAQGRGRIQPGQGPSPSSRPGLRDVGLGSQSCTSGSIREP